MTPAPDPDRTNTPSTWGPWLTWTWAGILLLCAPAVAIEWDDLALALDLARSLR